MMALQGHHVIHRVYACSLMNNSSSDSKWKRSTPDLSGPSSLGFKFNLRFPFHPTTPISHSLSFIKHSPFQMFFSLAADGIGGSNGNNSNNKGTGGGGGGDEHGGENNEESGSGIGFGILAFLLSGWRSRVAADPQFPFKLLMEELVGVSACVLGDMASRPNFGLNELDFVFSTLVVGSILNFALMYLLAPTLNSAALALPGIFSACPPNHMFQPGAYSLPNRLGTFVYKGVIFSAVGFAAGLVGTAMSNGLIAMRKRMDPTFETPNKAPPTIINALTWAAHMGISSNFRYQTLNGIEYLLEKGLPPLIFKSSVLALRSANNVLGGMSFVVLARITGSQKVDSAQSTEVAKESTAE